MSENRALNPIFVPIDISIVPPHGVQVTMQAEQALALTNQLLPLSHTATDFTHELRRLAGIAAEPCGEECALRKANGETV